MLHRSLATACALIFVTSFALADTETVRLADGSVFSGELVEKVPGDHVTIKLATGEVRHFAWSAMAPTSLAVAAGPTPVAVVPQLPPLPTRIGHVRFVSDSVGALLMRVDSVPSFQGWVQRRESPVCYAPCNADVDANATYYVTGVSITQSSPFAIPEGSPTVSVRGGSEALNVTGAIFISLGSISAIMGAIATPIAFADAKTSGINGWEAFGLSALIGGVVFILAGIPFVVAGRTRVSLGSMDVARLASGFSF